ncbi:hypothetical protein [Catenulispora rubra]|uniref:hypothetical protein n=1 Tax=Catenulispora rubra TaxID=280293 RepID=UPI0018921346|nr:hypothetical protein [Catenulispora rubra]
MFKAIAAKSRTAAAHNAARREVQAVAKAAWCRGDKTAWRQARERLAAMPGYRRPCRASTRQRIRATQRSALTAARREQLVPVNAAALVEMTLAELALLRFLNELLPPLVAIDSQGFESWRAIGDHLGNREHKSEHIPHHGRDLDGESVALGLRRARSTPCALRVRSRHRP